MINITELYNKHATVYYTDGKLMNLENFHAAISPKIKDIYIFQMVSIFLIGWINKNKIKDIVDTSRELHLSEYSKNEQDEIITTAYEIFATFLHNNGINNYKEVI